MRISFPRAGSCWGELGLVNPARHRGEASPGSDVVDPHFHVGNERCCSLTSGVSYVGWISVLQDVALIL